MNRLAGMMSVLLLCLMLQNGCGRQEPANQRQEGARETVKQKTIEDVLAERTPEWMAIPGVVGTGIGECDGKPCITVLVVQATDSLKQRIPKQADGYPVRLEVSGEIRAN